MSKWQTRFSAIVALSGLVLMLPGDGQGQAAWAYYPSVHWSGTVKDAALAMEAPRSRFLLDQDTFAQLWNKWSLGGSVPQVDFSRNLVVVATSMEGIPTKLRLHTIGGPGGDPVKVQFDLGKDKVEGFAFTIGVFNREKIKSINGQDVPKTKPIEF